MANYDAANNKVRCARRGSAPADALKETGEMGTVPATSLPHREFSRGERKHFRVGGLSLAAELEMQGDP